MNKYELSYNDICYKINRDAINNMNTDETKIDFLGQKKAIEILNFGLAIESNGYNIFLSGEMGTHKEENIINYITKIAKEKEVPKDWCYVYNFENELKPKALALPSGRGYQFKLDVKELINNIIREVENCLDSEEYKQVIEKIKTVYYDEGEKILSFIKDKAKELGFYTQISESGLYFVPVINCKKISEKEYDELSIDEQ